MVKHFHRRVLYGSNSVEMNGVEALAMATVRIIYSALEENIISSTVRRWFARFRGEVMEFEARSRS